MKEQDPMPYLDEAGQQTVDAIAQRAARQVIRALQLKDETATWQRVRKTLETPLAVAYNAGAEQVRQQ